MKKLYLLIALIILIFTSDIRGQYINNVRSLSLGRTGVANMFASDAFYLNPANVGRQRSTFKSRFYFSLFTGGGYGLSGDYFSYDFYRQYLVNNDGRILTADEKVDIINRVADRQTNGFSFWNILSFIYNSPKSGTFGISIDDKFGGDIYATKDLLEIMLYGNEIGRTYNLSGFNFFSAWVRQINFTYANKIKINDQAKYSDFHYGISLKPQLGFYYLASESNNYSIYTDSIRQFIGNGGFDVYYAGLLNSRKERMQMGYLNPSGLGIALDLGGSIRVKDFLGMGTFDFGLSVVDIGYINWYKYSSRFHYDGDFFITDVTNQAQYDTLENILVSNRNRENFVTWLPTTVRFGFNYRLCLHKKGESRERNKDKLEFIGISMEYIQGLTNTYGCTTTPMFAMGTEINIGKVFSTRLGLTAGGREKFTISAGLGVDTGPVIIDVGTYNIQSLYHPKSSAKMSFGASIKYRIN